MFFMLNSKSIDHTLQKRQPVQVTPSEWEAGSSSSLQLQGVRERATHVRTIPAVWVVGRNQQLEKFMWQK